MSLLETTSELYNKAYQIGAGIGAAALWVLLMRGKKSQVDAGVHKDKTGSSLMDDLIKERDRALAEGERQRLIANDAMDKLREVGERALRASLQLEACEREESRTQSNLLRTEAELTESRKRVRRLQRALAEVNPRHDEVQGSDFAGLDE